MAIRCPLSSICQGTGTWSGDVKGRSLPLRKNLNCMGQDQGYTHSENLKLPNIDRVPKTFATRHGALLLFADTYDVWKQEKENASDGDGDNNKIVQQLKTLKELRRLVLSFGLDDESVIKRISAILHDNSFLQVRPGFSPNRYTSSAVRLWDPHVVDKYLENDVINKSVVQRYFDLLLPDVTVNGIVLKDTLLGSKPQKYTLPRLPKLKVPKHIQIDSDEMVHHKAELHRKAHPMVLPKIDFADAADLPYFIDHHVLLQKPSIQKILLDPNQKKFWNNYENLNYDEKADLLFRMLVSRKEDKSLDKDDKDLAKVENEKAPRKCIFPELENEYYFSLQVNPVPYKQNDNQKQTTLPFIVDTNIDLPLKNKTSKNICADNNTESWHILSGCLPNDVESTERVELPKFLYRPTKLTSHGISHLDQNFSKHKDNNSNNLVIQGTAFTKNDDDNFSFGSMDISATRPSSQNSYSSISSNHDIYKNYDNINYQHDNDIATINDATSKSLPNLLKNNFVVPTNDYKIVDDLNSFVKNVHNDGNDGRCSSNHGKQSLPNAELDLYPQQISSDTRKEINTRDSNSSIRSGVPYKDNEIDVTEKIKHESNIFSQHSTSSFKKKKKKNTNVVSNLNKEKFTNVIVSNDLNINAESEGDLSYINSIKYNALEDKVNSVEENKFSNKNDNSSIIYNISSMGKPVLSADKDMLITTDNDSNNHHKDGELDIFSLNSHIQKVKDTSPCQGDEIVSLPLKGGVEDKHDVGDTLSHKDEIHDIGVSSFEIKSDITANVENVYDRIKELVSEHNINDGTSSNNLNITQVDKSKFAGSVTIVFDGNIKENSVQILPDIDSSKKDASLLPAYLDGGSDGRDESDSYLSSSSVMNISSSSSNDDNGNSIINCKTNKGTSESQLNVIIQDVLSRPGSGVDFNKDLSAAEQVYKAQVLKKMISCEVAEGKDEKEEKEEEREKEEKDEKEEKEEEKEKDEKEEKEEKEEEKEKDEKVVEECKATQDKAMTEVLQKNEQISDGLEIKSEIKSEVNSNNEEKIQKLATNDESVISKEKEIVSPKAPPFRVGTAMEEKRTFLGDNTIMSDQKISPVKKVKDKKNKDKKKILNKGKTQPLKTLPIAEVKKKPELQETQYKEADVTYAPPSKSKKQPSPLPSIPRTTEIHEEEKLPSRRESSASLGRFSSKSDFSRSSSSNQYIIRRSPASNVSVKEESPIIVSEEKSPVIIETDSDKSSVKKLKREKSAAERRAAVENKRKIQEEKRRLEKEEKLRDTELYILKVQEEDRRNEQLQLEMEDELQRKEDERQRALQIERERLEAEERERKRKEEEPKRLRMKKVAEEEAQRKKLELIMAERQMELEFKKAQEQMAKAIEADMAEKERVLMEQMVEEERILYKQEKKLEDALRKKEDEERVMFLELKKEEEEEKRVKELDELLRLQTKQLFTSNARRTNGLLEIEQQLSRAYTYSYFNLLPIIFYGTSNTSTKKAGSKVTNLSDVLDKLEGNSNQ